MSTQKKQPHSDPRRAAAQAPDAGESDAPLVALEGSEQAAALDGASVTIVDPALVRAFLGALRSYFEQVAEKMGAQAPRELAGDVETIRRETAQFRETGEMTPFVERLVESALAGEHRIATAAWGAVTSNPPGSVIRFDIERGSFLVPGRTPTGQPPADES